MPTSGPLSDDQAAAKMRTLTTEWKREWDALPWHTKLRRQFGSWWAAVFWKEPNYDDETLARFPSLAAAQREWEALPRREKWRERLAASGDSAIRLGNAWLWVGLVAFPVIGFFIKFVVPGGSDWLHGHTGLFFAICFAPLVLMSFALLLQIAVGWVALPFVLVIAFWRRVRRGPG